MLAVALEAEVDEFLAQHADRRDQHGHRLAVRNGHLPERSLVTGIGPIPIRQPRVDDRPLTKQGESRFSSAILPRYARQAPSVDSLIPTLYLKGVSSGDFSQALAAILGEQAAGLSATNVVRLKKVWEAEYQEYVYFWADGLHVQSINQSIQSTTRLDNISGPRRTMTAPMSATLPGVTPTGRSGVSSRALVIQHIVVETLGANFSAVLAEAGFETIPLLTAGAGSDRAGRFAAPDLAEIDLIVSLGGPQSANDRNPAQQQEIEYLRAAAAGDPPVPEVGVCLRAQLLARALGGAVAATGGYQFGRAILRQAN